MAAVGFGNTGGDIFERGGPYLVRGAQDLIPTSQLLDKYSPALFCTIRNYHDVEPKVAASLGGNGYSLRTPPEIVGAGNPYVYPDNLPRVNARGGPEGRPGCWQPITRDLWPAPYLVMDTGASIAPYNHLEARRQPFAWHRDTSGAARSGRTRSTHENHRNCHQARHLLTGAAALHRDHHRGVRSDAVRPHHRVFGDLLQRQRPARGPVRSGLRRRGRQGLQGRADRRRSKVRVDFNVDRSLPLFDGTTASIRYLNLIGDRYMELKRGDSDKRLPAGGTIPLERTEPALDLDALIGGFRPLFRALDPDKVNNIAQSIITIFQGQGGTINDILDQTASLTSALADRDQAIGEVIKKPEHSAGHDGQASAAVRRHPGELREADHRPEEPQAIRSRVRSPTSATRRARSPTCSPTTGRCCRAPSASSRSSSNRWWTRRIKLNDILVRLPTAFKIIGRAGGIYGDFFNFYACDISLKLNGLQPGGPVRTVKLTSQPSGRCTPQ